MDRKARAVAELIAFLSEAFPSFRPSERTADAWLVVLKDYSPDQLRGAALALAKYHTMGAPSVGNVVEAIEGKLMKVPVADFDLYGRRIIGSHHYETRRVPYGEEVPLIESPQELERIAQLQLLPPGSDKGDPAHRDAHAHEHLERKWGENRGPQPVSGDVGNALEAIFKRAAKAAKENQR